MIDTLLLVLRTRVRARRHIEDGLPQWMVTAGAYLNLHLREPLRAPKKIHLQIRQLVRQGDALLVRHLAAIAPLHLLPAAHAAPAMRPSRPSTTSSCPGALVHDGRRLLLLVGSRGRN